jgi:hypothetical protein
MSFSTFVMPEPNDASVTYLADILGHRVVNGVMGTPWQPQDVVDSHIFSRMMDVFNHLLLGGGLIIFAILLFVGTMNTAADGKFLGREWHAIWTPIRLIFGILFVVPLKTGYCLGQYIILYAIFIGINFATTLWQHTINDVFNNQDTPPPPTYLTTEIQQVLGEALNTIAVPGILEAMTNGSNSPLNPGNQSATILLPVNNLYSISNNNIPIPLENAIQKFSTTPTNGYPGVCQNLYGGLNQDCGGAVNAALQGNSSGTANPNVMYQVSIGSSASIPPIFNPNNTSYGASYAYFSGFPQQNASILDGKIQVYGDYVYDPAFIASAFSVPGASGGGAAPTPPSTGPSCLLGSNPGCTPTNINGQSVYSQLVQVMNSGIFTPLSSGGSSVSTNVCNSTVPTTITDPTTGATIQTSLSPCDLEGAVSAVLAQARVTAQQLVFQQAGTLNSAAPQNSSAPTPNDPYSVPPTGQAAALSNNMYQYQDAHGMWHIGYNLNDYWIANINSQNYIDLQLNNSWWVAGSAYLVLDNALGQNLAWMSAAIQNALNKFSTGMANNTVSPDLNYSCALNQGQFVPDTTHLTSVLTPEFCVNYGIQVMERDPNLSPTTNGYSTPDNPFADICGIYKVVQPSSTSPNGNVVYYYSCNADRLRVSEPAMYTFQYTQSDIGVSNWASLIAPYDPSVPGNVDTSSTPLFYQTLQNMPVNLQGPMAVLLTQTQASCPAPPPGSQPIPCIAGYQKLYPYLVYLVNLLAYNGLLSSNQIAATLPVNESIDNIFNQLIGGHASVGSTSEAQYASSSLNSVMQQVYNLGMTTNMGTDSGAVSAQFSLIQQAQAAGISMIMACVTSLEAVYTSYSGALQGMVNNLSSTVDSSYDYVKWFNIAGAIPVIGSAFSAVSSVKVDQLQLALMTTTVTTLTSIAVQLMWLPLLLFIITSLFTAGVQFAILVPLMPYILFWAGQIAWLIGVLEAVVAAPLVMLGLAHPGGHQFMGHALPAVKMLIGVMFRPVLMIIGLIVGILLTYIVINFSAQGFHTVAAGILNAVPASESMVQGILACLLLFIYASFLVLAFQKCFSTIYVIPERVVEWIGGSAARAGPEELQQMQQATTQSAQAAGSAGGDALNKGLSAQQSRASEMSQLSQKTLATNASISKAEGDAAGQGLAALQEAGMKMATLAI